MSTFLKEDALPIELSVLPQRKVTFSLGGAPIAQLGEHATIDRKVASLILTRGAVLCPWARHFIPIV